jgi:hypothetical protein
MGIVKGEEVQVKVVGNIFKRMRMENFLNPEKQILIQVQETCRTWNRHDQNRTSPHCTTVKTSCTESKNRILKAIRGKHQISYKGKPMIIRADLLTETFKSGRAWNKLF